MAKKTANELLHDSKDMPKIVILDDPLEITRLGGERMLIAPPLAYDSYMKRVPRGKLTTSEDLRKALAHEASADFTCHLTAGIFINIVARASMEREEDKTPFWRTLKKNGQLNEKYPGGIEQQQLLLESEGFEIFQKGKNYFVKDYDKHLVIW